jgi:hypothetical protein
MNRFLPHPSDVPVELTALKHHRLYRQRLHTISLGGVVCNYPRAYRRGTAIEMYIPALGEEARYTGYVAWCRKQEAGYLIGIAFTDEQTLFGARMGEQVCQIKHFCEQHNEDAESIDTLAREWVDQHATEFSQASLSQVQEPPPTQPNLF